MASTPFFHDGNPSSILGQGTKFKPIHIAKISYKYCNHCPKKQFIMNVYHGITRAGDSIVYCDRLDEFFKEFIEYRK
jgi:hypothetical protein